MSSPNKSSRGPSNLSIAKLEKSPSRRSKNKGVSQESKNGTGEEQKDGAPIKKETTYSDSESNSQSQCNSQSNVDPQHKHRHRGRSAVDRLMKEEEERKNFELRSSSNLSEIKKAKHRLDKQNAKLGGKIKKIKRDQNEDQMLERQKQAAIAVIQKSNQFDKNVELVRDDSYNNALQVKIDSVELKIDQLDLIFTQLLSRGKNIGREQEILPWISSILQIIVQLFHRVNLEAFRIGVLSRALILPETQTMNLETTFEWINVCKVQYDITAKIFKLILAFMRQYINNSFNVVMYVNMNRILKSENDVNLINKDLRTLMRKANFFRLQNVIFTKYFAHKWAQSNRDTMKAMNFKQSSHNAKDEPSEFQETPDISGTQTSMSVMQKVLGPPSHIKRATNSNSQN